MLPATDFTWPMLPLQDGTHVDLRVFSGKEPFSRFTTHLMAPGSQAGFAAFSPEHQLMIGYQWTAGRFSLARLVAGEQKAFFGGLGIAAA